MPDHPDFRAEAGRGGKFALATRLLIPLYTLGLKILGVKNFGVGETFEVVDCGHVPPVLVRVR